VYSESEHKRRDAGFHEESVPARTTVKRSGRGKGGQNREREKENDGRGRDALI